MRLLSEIPPEELDATLEYAQKKYEARRRQADRAVAWLYAQNLAFIEQMEAEAETEADSDPKAEPKI